MQKLYCEGFSFPLPVEEKNLQEIKMLTLWDSDILASSVTVAINKPRV